MRGESSRRDYGPPARVFGTKEGASFQIIVLVGCLVPAEAEYQTKSLKCLSESRCRPCYFMIPLAEFLCLPGAGMQLKS